MQVNNSPPRLIIHEINIIQNKVIYKYSIQGILQICFIPNVEFFIEYSEDISNVPVSIAIIPFICNVLPVVWIFNAEIIIPELDKDFYEHIEEIKQGYIEMYPALKFGGKLTVQKIVDNSYKPTEVKTAAFFSGGVDSFATLIRHLDDRPALITLWGSDVKLNDIDGWQRVSKHAIDVAHQFHCANLFIKSTFRQFINEGLLSGIVEPVVHDGWWHGFQHGIGIIGHIAPYVYIHKLSKIYFASTYTEKYKVTCASDPSIDNHVHISNCITIHDGYELNRQGKVRLICDYRRKTGEQINLRVCWSSIGGKNCCSCEKCYRTICALLVEGEDPSTMGFDYSSERVAKMWQDFKNPTFIGNKINLIMYEAIIHRVHEVPENLQKAELQKWTAELDFSAIERVCSQYLNGR